MMRPLILPFALAAMLAACSPPQTDAEVAGAEATPVTPHTATPDPHLESEADAAFAALKAAEDNYPPAATDPGPYNAAITRAYHEWETAAQAAYGPMWRATWREQHAGSTASCDELQKFGMPLKACFEAAAAQGDIEPLEAKLMKCPSSPEGSSGMFNPRSQEDCERRESLFGPLPTATVAAAQVESAVTTETNNRADY